MEQIRTGLKAFENIKNTNTIVDESAIIKEKLGADRIIEILSLQQWSDTKSSSLDTCEY